MQTASHLPSPEHKCPDCFLMDLDLVPLLPKSKQDEIPALAPNSALQNQPKQVDVYLNIQFGEHQELLRGGYVRFGLRGGELKMTLEGCEMPLSNRTVFDALETTVLRERSMTTGREDKSGIKASFNEGKSGVETNFEQAKKIGTADKFQFDVSQINCKGSAQSPAWEFEEKMGEPILKGLRQNVKLGTLNITTEPCYVTAIFYVPQMKDVKFSGGGLWLNNLFPEGRATVDRMLVRLFLKSKLEPYLSKIEKQYPS
jgi:hypothetical protein